jgi:MFS family permease
MSVARTEEDSTTSEPRGTGLLISGLALAVLTLSLLQTLVVPVLSDISTQLHTSLTAVGWVLTANLLSAAVLTPVLGRMGDVYGKRPVILGILALVLTGVLLAVATSSLPVLIIGRILQGASYGLFPLSMGVLRDEVPAHRLPQSMAIVSATLGVGGVVGLVGTGLLTRGGGDYHHPFWIGVGFAVAALVLCYFTVPGREPIAKGARVDWIGAVILGVGLVFLLLAISQGEDWGWGSLRTIGSFVVAVVVLVGWIFAERRIANPLARPALLVKRGVMIPNVVALLAGFGLFAAFLGLTDFVETPSRLAGYGFTASVLAASAVYLLPGGVVGVLLAPFIGQFVHRAGPYRVMMIGAALGVIGFGALCVLHGLTWEVVVFGSLTQLAVTIGYATLPATLVQAVEPADTGVANSVNSITRSVGSAIASALTVVLLTSNVGPAGFPKESAFTTIFVLGTVSFALVIGLAILGQRTVVRGRPDAQQEAEEEAVSLAGEFSPISGLS